MARKSKYYVRPDGLHECSKIIGGKRKVFRGRTDAEVERKMLEYREEQSKGRRWEQVADAYQDEIRDRIKETTWEKCYLKPYTRAVELYQGRRVTEISARQIEAHLKRMKTQGYSKQVVVMQLQVIRQIFAVAVADGELMANPAEAVRLPSGLKAGKREMPTDSQLAAVRSAVGTDGIPLLAALTLYTGARRGEALALCWEDIDFNSGEISITKSAVYGRDNLPRIGQPKTASGVRRLPLLAPLKALLDEVPSARRHGYLVSVSHGQKPLTESQASKGWRQWTREHGINVTPHQLRHGFATICFDAGLDPKDIQALLGHAQISTTMDIYTDISERRRKVQKEALEEQFEASTQKLHRIV